MANKTLDTGVTVTPETFDGYDMVRAQKMHFVTSTMVGPFFVVIGIVGNILSILVWRRKKMRSTTAIYLIAQAIADIGLLLFFLATDSIPTLFPGIRTVYAYGVFYAYIGYPLFLLFVVCSIWITVGVTVDRYIKVCWVSKSKEMCSRKRAFLSLGIITTLCFVINSPHFATFTPVSNNDKNHSSDQAYAQTEYGSGSGSQNYEFWLHCMFLVLAPWISIFILNLLIVYQVNKVTRAIDCKRESAGKLKSRKSEAHLTRILLTVTFAFLILLALQCITQCFFMLKTGNYEIVSEAFSVAKLGVVINSSINFILYCVSGDRYRKELRHVVCRPYLRERLRSISMSLSSSSSSYNMSRVQSTASST